MDTTNTQNTSEQQKVPVRYTGFWVRGAALFIDSLIIGFIAMFVVLPITLFAEFVDNTAIEFSLRLLGYLVSLLIAWGYYVFMTYKFQATIGKKAVGAKVIGDNGKKLGLGAVVLRETIGKIVSGLILDIGYLMAAFTQKKQGLHDMMAHSIVVYKDPEKGPNKPVVIVVYVIYSLITFVAIFAIIAVGLLAGLAIFGASQTSDTDYYLQDDIDGFEDTLEDWDSTMDTDVDYMIDEF